MYCALWNRCTIRIGKGIHPDGVPGWCQGFSLDGGSGVRAVKVIQQGNRPGLIYNIGNKRASCTVRTTLYAYVLTDVTRKFLIIGIDVKKGKGRYRDTHIVTFAPRYLLDNRSSHKLAFSQREFARGKVRIEPVWLPLMFLMFSMKLALVCFCCQFDKQFLLYCVVAGHFKSRGLHLNPARL